MSFRPLADMVAVFASLGIFATLARADVIASPANDLLLQANGGVAAQSSTLAPYGATADRGNDGNRDGTFADNSVTHTAFEQGWLEVQMPAAHVIAQVDVWNRTDCCGFGDPVNGDRLDTFEVQIFLGANQVYSTTPQIFVPSQFIPSSDGGTGAAGEFFAIIPNVIGDRVRVQKVNADYLHLAELEAYEGASAVPEPATCILLGLGTAGLGLFTRLKRRKTGLEIG